MTEFERDELLKKYKANKRNNNQERIKIIHPLNKIDRTMISDEETTSVDMLIKEVDFIIYAVVNNEGTDNPRFNRLKDYKLFLEFLKNSILSVTGKGSKTMRIKDYCSLNNIELVYNEDR